MGYTKPVTSMKDKDDLVRSLAFDHNCTDAHKRLTGNTCARSICIPIKERYTKCNTEVFALNVLEDIFDNHGLGQR